VKVDRIVDYTVVSEYDLEKMVRKVQSLIKSGGWQPYGSFQVATPVTDKFVAPIYCQAMIKSACNL
jgi:hypothetical protein